MGKETIIYDKKGMRHMKIKSDEKLNYMSYNITCKNITLNNMTIEKKVKIYADRTR